MTNPRLVPDDLGLLYEFHEWRNALAVLTAAYPDEWADLVAFLRWFRILRSDLGEAGEKGGGKTKLAIRIDRDFRARGWKPKQFDTRLLIDGVAIESPTHEVDCFKGKVALELEWNNKTEFYDRDLNNFRLLFNLRVCDVGVILTRCDELQAIFRTLNRAGSYGSTTTVLSKLRQKLDGGAGGGCPVLAIGMRQGLYVDDKANPERAAGFARIERGSKRGGRRQ